MRKIKLRPCRICARPARKTRCPSCETSIRRFRCKQAAIRLLGGKCVRCGFAGGIAAFQFHHRNPKEKDFGIGAVTQKSWKVIKQELAKCDLLCANCHCLEHATFYTDPRVIEEAARYKGTELYDAT